MTSRLSGAVIAIAVAATVAVGVAVGQGAAAPTIVRAGVAAVATALLVGLVLATAAARLRPRALQWAVPLVLTVGAASVAVIPAGFTRLLGPQIGPIHILVLGASGGIVGGALLAPMLRGSLPNPVPPAHAALLAEHQHGWWHALLRPAAVALLAVIALLVASLTEPGSMTELRATTDAVFLDDALPTMWEPCCGGTSVMRGHELDQHICGNDDAALPAHVAAATRSFKQPTPGEPAYADGHLDISVLLAPSEREAIREFRAVHDGAYLPCTTQSVGRLAVYWQALATGGADVTFVSREDLDGVDGVIDTFRIRIPIDEYFDVTWASFIRFRIGRAIVRMPLLTFSIEPPDLVERQAIIDGALRHIETALGFDAGSS